MPQLVPFFFINLVIVAFILLVVKVYIPSILTEIYSFKSYIILLQKSAVKSSIANMPL